MDASIIRLVPKTPFDRGRVEDLARTLGWTLHSTKEDGKNIPYEAIWLSADRGAGVHWIEDDLIQVHYLLVEGPDQGPTLELLRQQVDLYDAAGLADLFDGTRDPVTLMNALRVLGIHCTGPVRAEMFALFLWAMNDPEPLVRRQAVFCASFTEWDEFDPFFEYLVDHDPSPEVRETLREVIQYRARPRSRGPFARLVPKAPSGRQLVAALAEKSGWRTQPASEGGDGIRYEAIWFTVEGDAEIHWIEDDSTRVDYLLVGGPEMDRAVELLTQELDVYGDADLVDLFDSARDGVALMNALRVLGVHCASKPFEEELYALFRWAFNDPDPLVRRIAVFSAGNAGWGEFDGLIGSLRDQDPVPEVREDARAVIEAWARRRANAR